MHAGNAYMDNGNYIVDFEMYDSADADPFSIFDIDYLHGKGGSRTPVNMYSRYRRYTINTTSGEVTHRDILSYDEGSAGFPIVNPTFHGVKNCYTYITEFMYFKPETSILKINHCNGDKVTQRWTETGVFMTEPFFVDDPTSDREDDGVITVPVYDDKLGVSRLVLLDARTMTPQSSTKLPIRIPLSLHSGFFPKQSTA